MSSTTVQPRIRSGVRLGHAAVVTPDLDRFRRFYEDVVGLRQVAVQHPPQAPMRRLGVFTDAAGDAVSLLAFEIPGYESGLADDLLGRRGRVDHITFLVTTDEDFRETTARLVDAGASSGQVDLLGPVWSVLFVDPDGARRNLQLANPEWHAEATVEVLDADLLESALRGLAASSAE